LIASCRNRVFTRGILEKVLWDWVKRLGVQFRGLGLAFTFWILLSRVRSTINTPCTNPTEKKWTSFPTVILSNQVNFSGVFIERQLERILFNANAAHIDSSLLHELEGEEKFSAISSCTWDVDFVSIFGDLDALFNDEEIAELLGNCSGKTLSSCCMQNVRTELFGRMLMFAKAGDWMIGYFSFILGVPIIGTGMQALDDEEDDSEDGCPKTEVFCLYFRLLDDLLIRN
jgi:hypothetical protein